MYFSLASGSDKDHRFVPTYEKGSKGKYQIVVSEKKWSALKQGLKLITKKTAACTFSERIAKLKELYRGWINYFRMAKYAKLKEFDRWLRNRLRYDIAAGKTGRNLNGEERT